MFLLADAFGGQVLGASLATPFAGFAMALPATATASLICLAHDCAASIATRPWPPLKLAQRDDALARGWLWSDSIGQTHSRGLGSAALRTDGKLQIDAQLELVEIVHATILDGRRLDRRCRWHGGLRHAHSVRVS